VNLLFYFLQNYLKKKDEMFYCVEQNAYKKESSFSF